MTTTPFEQAMFDTASGRRLKRECGPCEPGAELTITPLVLYFGYMPPGTLSDWQPLLITNSGVTTIGVQALEITGEFEIENNAPVNLAPGEVATYSVRFGPLGSGLRTGDIIVNAATAGDQPVVKCVGIGGELAGGGAGSSIGAAWAYRYGSFAVEIPLTNEILMDYHVTTVHRLQSNLAGCKVSSSTPPEADYVLQLLKNNVQVATMTIHPNGTVTMATTSGQSVQVPINSIMTVRAPTTVGIGISRIRMTFVGVV